MGAVKEMKPEIQQRSIFTALCAIQKDLAEQGISKNQTNTFDNYKFRGIDDVLNAMAPILSKHGVVIIPCVESVDTQVVQTSQGKASYRSLVTVDYCMYDTSGDGTRHRMVGEAMDRGDKSVNKALSAAFKYFLFQAFCIPLQGQDADAESHEIAAPESHEIVAPQIPQAPSFPVPPTAEAVNYPQNTYGPGGAQHTIQQPPNVQPVTYAAPQTAAQEQPVFNGPATEEEAAQITDVMIGLATKMHASSREELVGFWNANKQTINMLDTSYPAQYQRIKQIFTELNQKLGEAQ